MTIRLDPDYTAADVLSLRYRALQNIRDHYYQEHGEYPLDDERYKTITKQIQDYCAGHNKITASWSQIAYDCVMLAWEWQEG